MRQLGMALRLTSVLLLAGCGAGASAVESPSAGLDTWQDAHDIALPLEPAQELTFVSYNVFLRPDLISSGDYVDCRGAEIGRTLASWGADVVALQETWAPSAVTRLVTEAEATLPVRVVGRPAAADGAPASGGLSLLSRWPIEAVTSERYASCTGSDCLSSKGILHAVVRVAQNARLHVVTTHLNAGGSSAESAVRADQLRQLRAFLDRLDPAIGPIVLLGDLNVDSLTGDGEYDRLLGVLEVVDGPDTATSTVNCDTSVFCPSPVPPARIDYILLEGAESRLARGATRHAPLPRPNDVCDGLVFWLSDHRLVETRVSTAFP